MKNVDTIRTLRTTTPVIWLHGNYQNRNSFAKPLLNRLLTAQAFEPISGVLLTISLDVAQLILGRFEFRSFVGRERYVAPLDFVWECRIAIVSATYSSAGGAYTLSVIR